MKKRLEIIIPLVLSALFALFMLYFTYFGNEILKLKLKNVKATYQVFMQVSGSDYSARFLPKSAVTEDMQVFVLMRDFETRGEVYTLIETPVKFEYEQDGYVVIKEGLRGADLVLEEPYPGAKSGDKVVVVKSKND